MKIQSPWMGRIKGSAGNMTGCKVYDKNVMRAKAFEVNNPNTAAQQVQRGYFADLTKLVAGFTPDQLRTLFPNKPKAMSRRNALSKQLAEYNTMSGTEKVIDFAKIDTLGNAATMNFGTILIEKNENSVIMTWDEPVITDAKYSSSQIVGIFVNETKNQMIFPLESAAGSEGMLAITYPSGWENTDTIHAFPLITDQTSTVASFGSFIIKVRPEKKSH